MFRIECACGCGMELKGNLENARHVFVYLAQDKCKLLWHTVPACGLNIDVKGKAQFCGFSGNNFPVSFSLSLSFCQWANAANLTFERLFESFSLVYLCTESMETIPQILFAMCLFLLYLQQDQLAFL